MHVVVVVVVVAFAFADGCERLSEGLEGVGGVGAGVCGVVVVCRIGLGGGGWRGLG